jgi:hypothetical protein
MLAPKIVTLVFAAMVPRVVVAARLLPATPSADVTVTNGGIWVRLAQSNVSPVVTF